MECWTILKKEIRRAKSEHEIAKIIPRIPKIQSKQYFINLQQNNPTFIFYLLGKRTYMPSTPPIFQGFMFKPKVLLFISIS